MLVNLSRIMTMATELLRTSVLEEEGFKSNKSLKSREEFGLPYLDKKLVPPDG